MYNKKRFEQINAAKSFLLGNEVPADPNSKRSQRIAKATEKFVERRGRPMSSTRFSPDVLYEAEYLLLHDKENGRLSNRERKAALLKPNYGPKSKKK